MEVVVCVGWRGGEPVREANWSLVRAHYASMGLPIVTGDSDPDQPFLLPRALNRAVDAAIGDGADVVVVSDADVLISVEHLAEAVRVADEQQALVHPVTRYWRLDRAGNPPPKPELYFAGAIHVFGREAWQFFAGYDERFEGWAPHDAAMLFTAVTFGRYAETDGDVCHLWHPTGGEWRTRAKTEGWLDMVELLGDEAPPGYGDNGPRPVSPLSLRYHAALFDPAAMGVLLHEAAQARAEPVGAVGSYSNL